MDVLGSGVLVEMDVLLVGEVLLVDEEVLLVD